MNMKSSPEETIHGADFAERVRSTHVDDVPHPGAKECFGAEDIVFPSGEWGWHPRITGRLGPHRLLEMPGSHEVLFTNPDGLADKIIEGGRD